MRTDITEAVIGCNGESASYYVGNDTWNTTFFYDGTEYNVDMFYVTNNDELWVRTLQQYVDPSLYEALNDTVIRLNVTCTDYNSTCVEFRANSSEQSYYNYSSLYPFNGSCYHGFETGESVRTVLVPAAQPKGPSTSSSLSPNISITVADLGLTSSEGNGTEGKKKDDECCLPTVVEKTPELVAAKTLIIGYTHHSFNPICALIRLTRFSRRGSVSCILQF